MSESTVLGCAVLVLSFLCCVATCSTTSRVWETDAIRNGVGEYYLDENHNKQFRWKQQKASEE